MANQPECKCIVILFVQPKLSFNWDCDYKRQDKYCSFRFIYFFIICLRFEKKIFLGVSLFWKGSYQSITTVFVLWLLDTTTLAQSLDSSP